MSSQHERLHLMSGGSGDQRARDVSGEGEESAPVEVPKPLTKRKLKKMLLNDCERTEKNG
jgi:hypothetical protein